ncbi:hypothetical protein OFC13_29890, partial [Escherichia coli]|nr:hypothetical protein [Escherichia coli]
ELDPDQPRISAATLFNRVRHYRKLDKMEWVIKENTTRYNFSDIASYLGFQTVQTQSKTDTDRLLVNSFNRDNTTHCKNNILNVT